MGKSCTAKDDLSQCENFSKSFFKGIQMDRPIESQRQNLSGSRQQWPLSARTIPRAFWFVCPGFATLKTVDVE